MASTINMSIDDKIEQAAYAAVAAVSKMPWKAQRARILKNIVKVIMMHMGWKEIRLEDDQEAK